MPRKKKVKAAEAMRRFEELAKRLFLIRKNSPEEGEAVADAALKPGDEEKRGSKGSHS